MPLLVSVAGVTVDIDPEEFTYDEVDLIERTVKTPFPAFLGSLRENYAGALRVALWVAMRRSDPGLALEDVNPKVKDVTFVADPDPEPEPAATEPEPEGDAASFLDPTILSPDPQQSPGQPPVVLAVSEPAEGS